MVVCPRATSSAVVRQPALGDGGQHRGMTGDQSEGRDGERSRADLSDVQQGRGGDRPGAVGHVDELLLGGQGLDRVPPSLTPLELLRSSRPI